MTAALDRILTTPLKATERGGMSSVRVAADSFHVATISAGMNDQAEYARPFAAAPAMLAALRSAHDFLDRHGNGWEEAETLRQIWDAIASAEGIDR